MRIKFFFTPLLFSVLFVITSCGTAKKSVVQTRKPNSIKTHPKRVKTSSTIKKAHPIRTKELEQTGVLRKKDIDFYSLYSQKLNIALTGIEDKKLIEVVTDWKGTTYLYGGNNKTGVDCSGFVGAVYQEVYNKKLHRRSRDMLLDVKIIKKSKLCVGDLIFFKTGGKNYVSHVGIYIADNKFIHAASRGVVVNDLNDTYYRKAYYKSGRVK